MKYSQVLQDAWKLASENRKLVWFAFMPSFVTVILFVAESAWQFFFMFEEFGRLEHGTVFREIGSFLSFVSARGLWGWFIFLIFVIFLFSFVFPSLIQGSMILGIRQKFTTPTQRLSIRQKTIEGSSYFFKLFEFHALTSPFAFLSLIFYFLAFYRYTHGDTSHFFFKLLILMFIAAIFINLFLAYTPFFIVCEKENLGTSLKKSIGLVFLNLGKTIGLVLLMLLVNLRVIINVLVVFGVPIGIIAIASSFTSSSWFAVIIGSGILVGISMIGLAAYLAAILEVFSLGFWERSFTKLRIEQKKLEFSEEEVEEVETIKAERIGDYVQMEQIQKVIPKPLQIKQENETPHLNKPQVKEDETTIHFKAE